MSGRWSALGLLGLFVLSATVVPLALRRDPWIEVEIVLGIWFAIWVALLTWLGYSGRVIEQDWGELRSTWRRIDVWLGRVPDQASAARAGTSSRSTGPDGLVELDPGPTWTDFIPFTYGGEGLGGCATELFVVALIAGVVWVAYVVIGWVVPLVAFTLYGIVRAMLNRVGDRADETRGDLRAALSRAILWATVYTAPLALVVLAIHALS